MYTYIYMYIYICICIHTLMLCSFLIESVQNHSVCSIFEFDPQIVTLKFSAQENSRVLAQIHRKGAHPSV